MFFFFFFLFPFPFPFLFLFLFLSLFFGFFPARLAIVGQDSTLSTENKDDDEIPAPSVDRLSWLKGNGNAYQTTSLRQANSAFKTKIVLVRRSRKC
jgi:hypothetical protein